jgi:trehalose 6-phosphate synthase/phosphatase
MAVPTEDTLTALAALSADPRNLVYIISGRDGAFLEQHLGHIEGLGMSAEHGGFIRAPGSRQWTNFTESIDMSWMSEVLEVFKYYTERTTGSHIEVKRSSITWHYRATDPEWGYGIYSHLSVRAESKSHLLGNSNAGSVRIYSRTTLRISGQLKV